MTASDPWADELVVELSAPFAAAANQSAEESFYVAWATMRARDTAGSGRLRRKDANGLLKRLWSAKQVRRLLSDQRARRWWELEERFVRLRGQEDVFQSFDDVDLPSTAQSRLFRIEHLCTRPRRTAALVATVVADEGPRSLAFISRFTGVDRSTLHRLSRDPFIRGSILQSLPQWTES